MVINSGFWFTTRASLPPQMLVLVERMISISVVGQGLNQVYLIFQPNKTSVDKGQNAAVQDHINMACNTSTFPLEKRLVIGACSCA